MSETVLSKEAQGLGDFFLGEKDHLGEHYIFVKTDKIVEALLILRDEFGYDYFSECVAVDYSQWAHERDLQGRFEVVYNLLATSSFKRLFVKIGVDVDQPVATAIPAYQGAEFPEKEIRDLFGINFVGNEFMPGTRFMLPDDWIGHPLRKEYPLGGEDVLFDGGTRGPAVEDKMVPHAGESFEGKTGSEGISGR